jgi:hypothetical protein
MCIFDFLRTVNVVRTNNPAASMVREPIDQRSKDRGTLDPLIVLSLLLSAPDPVRSNLFRSRLRYPILSADAR